MYIKGCSRYDLKNYYLKIHSYSILIKKKGLKLISSNMGLGELIIFLVSFIIIVWLHGGTLFFWDTVIPFHPQSDLFYYSFTWNQLIGNGIRGIPNEWGSYFIVMYLLHLIGLGINISQTILFYILFSFSGFSMYRLIKFLTNNRYTSKFSIAALSGALLYMFNFYFMNNLIVDFFESWFIYSFLPLAIILFLKGLEKYLLKEKYFSNIFYLVVLVQIMSVGFWEPPYLVWTIFIFCIFTINFFYKYFYSYKNLLLMSKYILMVILIIFVTDLWWIYSYIVSSLYLINIISLKGPPGDAVAYKILLTSYLSYPSNPIKSLLEVIAFYPSVSHSALNVGYYPWGNTYLNYNLFFSIISLVFLVAVYGNILEKKEHQKDILHHKILFYSLFFLIYFALQGLNPSNQIIMKILLFYNFKYINLLYSTNFQFIGFPIIFLYSISFAKTVAFLQRQYLKDKSKDTNNYVIKINKRKYLFKKDKIIKMIIATILIIVVVVFPWYLWTPYPLAVFANGNGQQVPSVVNFPPYFYNMSNYINKNAHNGITLTLPMFDNFFSMNFNNSSFIDTLYPGLITGSPTLSEGNYNNNLSIDLENMIYVYPWRGNDFANLLNAINVKYVLLNTVPIPSIPGNPYYNLTYLENFLSHQPFIILIKQFGPLKLYENLIPNNMLTVGNAVRYNATISNPYEIKSIYPYFSNLTLPNNVVQCSYNYTNSSLILRYNRYRIPINPIFFSNAIPININITRYYYLIIKFRTSSSHVQFFVRGNTYFLNGLYGITDLHSMNLNLTPAGVQDIYNSALHNTTLIYPLYGQPLMPYSSVYSSNNLSYSQSHITLGLGFSFNNLVNNESGWIQIYNISVAKYISSIDSPFYLAGSVNTTKEVLTPSWVYTNNRYINNITLNYSEINPTQYTAKINNAKGSFILYFKQTYDPDWVLYINGKKVPDSLHFMADLYNNGWYVNTTGNYTLEITFTPQQIYNDVINISIYSTIFISIIFLYLTILPVLIKKKKKKHKNLKITNIR